MLVTWFEPLLWCAAVCRLPLNNLYQKLQHYWSVHLFSPHELWPLVGSSRFGTSWPSAAWVLRSCKDRSQLTDVTTWLNNITSVSLVRVTTLTSLTLMRNLDFYSYLLFIYAEWTSPLSMAKVLINACIIKQCIESTHPVTVNESCAKNGHFSHFSPTHTKTDKHM